VRKDDVKAEWVRKERDDLLQTMVGLCVEHDLARQERDDARGQVNDLLGEVEKERGLKLKAEDVSAGLAMVVAWGKAKNHTLEIEVSQQSREIDKLRSDVKGEPSGPMSLFFLDPRCCFDTIGVMAWAGLKDKLAEEVVKSRDLWGSLQKEHDEHDALRAAIGLVCDDLSLIPKQEGASLLVCATQITDWACKIMRLALCFGIQQSFAIARSHYENIDLTAMGQGYV
jgi:hypothetical protein